MFLRLSGQICVRGHGNFQKSLGPMSAHDQEFLTSSLGWFPFVDKLSSKKIPFRD